MKKTRCCIVPRLGSAILNEALFPHGSASMACTEFPRQFVGGVIFWTNDVADAATKLALRSVQAGMMVRAAPTRVPMCAIRIERLLAKVEAELARSARPRRYCFHFDEEAEAKAQGLPYILVPRVLSEQEWIEKYSPKQDGESR
jgi:hypothetical protein